MNKPWEKKTLNDLADIIMGQSPPSKTYNINGEGLPFFQGKTDFGFIYPNIRFYCSAPIKIAKKNDILLSVRAPVGPINLCKTDSCIGRGLAAIRVKNETNYLFLYYYLIHIRPQIEALGTGSTFQAINKSKIQNLEIQKPPLSEQRKIAAILSTVQKAIETEIKIIERTRELKKTMMHKLFTEGTRGEKQKMTEIGLIPESWEMVRLGEICIEIRNGLTIRQNKDNKGYKVTRIETISNFVIDEKRVGYVSNLNQEKLKRYLIKKGDILFSHINSDTHIGKTAISKKDYTDLLHGMNLLLIRVNEKISNSEYVNFLFNYFYYKRFFRSICKRAVNQSSISQSTLKSILIPLPPFPEQQAIVEILSNIDKKIEHHTTKKQKLEELFRTLLHELMTAQVRVDKVDLGFLETMEHFNE